MTTPPTQAPGLHEIAEQIEAALGVAELEHTEAQAVVTQTGAKVTQLRTALDALRGKPARSAETKAKKVFPSEAPDYVSPKTVEKIRLYMLQNPVSMTGTDAQTALRVSNGAAAMRRLHEQGLIRITGTTVGGGKTYMPMPEELEKYQEQQEAGEGEPSRDLAIAA
jgi:hypothetical protein